MSVLPFSEYRTAVRQLWRTPGFTLPTLCLLALTLGANATVFSVMNAVLFGRLPYADPDRLTAVWQQNRNGLRAQLSGPDFLDWRSRNHSFQHMSAVSSDAVNLVTNDGAHHVAMEAVSEDFFPMIGVPAEYGRWPSQSEHSFGSAPVLVISHRLWAQEFGSDPSVVGRSVLVNGLQARVVGIMPTHFVMPGDDSIDVYAPLELFTDLSHESRTSHNFQVIARLSPRTSIAQANREMRSIAGVLSREYPNEEDGTSAEIVSLRNQIAGDTRASLWLLVASSLALLLIGTANLAGMNVARYAARECDVLVRLALGGRGWQLLSRPIVESFVLAALGTGLGLALGDLILVLLSKFKADLPQSAPPTLNLTIAGLTFVLALGSCILFSVLPAVRQCYSTSLQGLQQPQGTSSRRQARMGRILVPLQLAITLVLLLACGDLLLSLRNIVHRSPGFSTEHRTVLTVYLPEARYRSHTAEMQFYDRLLQQASTIHEIRAIGTVNKLPFSGSWTNSAFEIRGRTSTAPSEQPYADYRTVSPGYFSAMGIPMLAGRAFSDSENESGAPVAIISAAEAKLYFSGADPIGQYIRISSYDDNAPWRVVVGVVRDVLHSDLMGNPSPTNYIPTSQTQNPAFTRSFFVVVEGANESGLGKTLATIVRQIDPAVSVEDHELGDLVGKTIERRQLATYMLLGYATLALIATLVGVAGLMSFVVVCRTQEIGVQMALGATRRNIATQVLKRALVISFIGLLGGIGIGLTVLRVLQSSVFGISVFDPLIMVTIPIVLLVVAVLAAAAPAMRAAKIDPVQAIRSL